MNDLSSVGFCCLVGGDGRFFLGVEEISELGVDLCCNLEDWI